MTGFNKLLPVCVSLVCLSIAACASVTKFMKGGLHRQLDENLTIVRMVENPKKYLNREIVFSVRYYKKADKESAIICPLAEETGKEYVNFIIADRVSYIMLNKIWIEKDKEHLLDSFDEMETVVMKARVFAVDEQKDPNLLALDIVPE